MEGIAEKTVSSEQNAPRPESGKTIYFGTLGFDFEDPKGFELFPDFQKPPKS